ncbi:DUF4132 domain-containing protein [Streptomyces sp. NPDC057565]|uniref:DUF4132 domain-containing protein n=1 Tax=Streptomyces sp. NPDC057565 TaxID=3346169 RepID=UPI0036B57651
MAALIEKPVGSGLSGCERGGPVRRWEYVEGTASKFWETGADGGVVTVRYGRVGSDGRTQTKEFASADAAQEQLRRTIAEKERKGYREVGGAASAVSPAPVVAEGAVSDGTPGALPDEDTFELPAVWRRHLHPRRGGVRRATARIAQDTLDSVELRLSEDREWIAEFLAAPRSDDRLVEATRAHLAGSPDPVGAAVLASVVGLHPLTYAAWADHWVHEYGLPFAARAVVELFMVEAHRTQEGRRRYDPWLESLTARRGGYWSGARRPAADRVRALLATTDEETYGVAVAALGGCRDEVVRRIVVSYLVPSETEWVAELCADPQVTGESDGTLRSMVFCSLNAPEQVGELGRHVGYTWSAATVGTVAEGIGTAVAPLLAVRLSDNYSVDYVKFLANALVELPSDEAFGFLLAHSDAKHVRAALFRAAHRYPVRALRLLAAAVRDGSAPGSAESTGLLLAGHIGAHRDVVTTVLATLDPDLVAVIDPLLNPVGRVADVASDTLPELLVSPPWSRPRKRTTATVISGLTAEAEPTVSWLPGEKEEWATCRSWYNREHGQEDAPYWEKQVAVYEATDALTSLEPAWVFLHGPEEQVRPWLDKWAPDDLWDVEETLKPVAARFGLDMLPVLLRAAPHQPSSIAPLLLPYVDVAVARHMADWSARLKSTAATARSWFTRHGATAAAHLVPDAVGKAGPSRRAAEQALVQIAAVHGDAVVHDAAAGYGAAAAAVVDELLAADPLERALPARLPVVPEWAEAALLPQILVRGGGALPEESVRNALMMLALSKPGETYPGVAALMETADPESLAAFAWALFEQWRLAGMPAKESWTLQALGLLGDDGTVRRLTPVIRAWPGEGAHHRAVEGLDVLAAIGTDVALLHLHGISQRVKFKALKVRAQEKIAEVASGLGLTGEQLSDRLVPDLGLDAEGSTVVDYGTRRFTVAFDEQLRPYVLDDDGKRRKDLPMPGARDDAELAPAERKRFMALKKDVRTIASDQVRRLEAAMVARRSWTMAEFRELFLQHPLLWHLVRRLVWLSETDGVTTAFRVAEDRTFADVEDDTFEPADGATVRIAHPLALGERLDDWSEVFADYEILQPFPQLGRAVFRLTDEEADGHRLTRFEGLKVPTGKVLGLERRGWERGTPQDAGVERWISKRLADNVYLVIALDDGIAVGVVDMFPDQTLETVWLDDHPSDHFPRRSYPLRFAGLDTVTVSELLADLTELTEGVAS